MKFLYGLFTILCAGLSFGCVIITIPIYDMAMGGLTTGKGQQLYYGLMLIGGAVVFLVVSLLCYRKYKRLKAMDTWFY